MSMTDIAAGFVTAAAIKAPCRVATPGTNVDLAGTYVLDSITLVAGDRVLVKDQDNAYENGIYVAAANNWARASDFDSTKEVVRGTRVFITDGSSLANTEWWVSSLDPVPVGTGSISFTQMGAGEAAVPSARTITTGTGLSGGGDLSADRTIAFAPTGLAAIGAVDGDADYLVLTDGSDSNAPKKAKISTVVGTGAVTATRQVIAGNGLSGGGTLAADRTIDLDFSEISYRFGIAFDTDQLALHGYAEDAPVRCPVDNFVSDMAKRRATGADPTAKGVAGTLANLRIVEEAVALSGSYMETAAMIPAGAILLAVASRVTKTVSGTTSFSVGISTDPDMFSANLAIAAGTTDAGGVGAQVITAARAVRLTPADTTTFTGGTVRVAIIYIHITPPTG